MYTLNRNSSAKCRLNYSADGDGAHQYSYMYAAYSMPTVRLRIHEKQNTQPDYIDKKSLSI